jgi:hypothetical protein
MLIGSENWSFALLDQDILPGTYDREVLAK